MTFHELTAIFTADLLALDFESVRDLRITHHKDKVEVEYSVSESFSPSSYYYFYNSVSVTPDELLTEWRTHLDRHDPRDDRELRALNEATAKVVALSKEMSSEAARAFGLAFAETLAANSTSLPAPK